jgi:two-component SAPR family response regulator
LHFDYARSLISLGQNDKAKENLHLSLELTARLGYDQFLINAIRKDLWSVEPLLNTLNSPHADSLLIRARKPLPSLDDLVLEEQEDEKEETVVLSVYGLNNGQVRLNGSVLPQRSWNSVGARALFYFILDRKRVTKEEIALEFWPDFSQAKVTSNFHATLWRVRNALGSKTIIQFEDGAYCFSPKAKIYFDVDEIESLFKQLQKTESTVEHRIAIKRVIELYQTDFIEDIDMPWADKRRHELQNRFRSILAELAEEYYQKDNPDTALELYERLIAYDPFNDHYHLRIMQCLVGREDMHSARDHYQRYATLLNDEMGLSPDESLRRLLAELD